MLVYSIRIEKKDIGYLKWLLESHDGLATPTTRDDTVDIIDLLVSPDFGAEVEALLEALKEEMTLEIVDTPTRPPLGG